MRRVKMHRRIDESQRCRPLRGGIFLFVVFLLPILILGIILINEIPLLSFSSNSQQATIDTLVLSAAQKLPDDGAAKQSFYANSPFPTDSTELRVTPESIEALVTTEQTSLLLRYFGVEKKISTTVRAKAIIPPLSVTVALDTNRYTAPIGTKAWETNSPAAGLFSADKAGEQESQLSAIRQTQSCFNEISLPLKRIVTETYRSLSRVPRYRLSAAVMPGIVGGPYSPFIGITPIKSVKDISPQWVEYSGLYHSNSICASAALHETLFVTDSPYRFPPRETGITPGVGPAGERIVDVERRTFNTQYAPYLGVEEIFWSQAAKEYRSISTVDSIFSLGQFAIGEDRAVVSAASRKGPGTVVAVVVAGDLPRSAGGRFPLKEVEDELQKVATQLNQLALDANVVLHLPYLLFKNREGVTLEEGASFSAFLSRLNASTPNLRMTALMAESAETLEQTLLPFLRNLRQPVVLSR